MSLSKSINTVNDYMKPIDTPIDELVEKYKGVELRELYEKRGLLVAQALDLDRQIREMHIVEGFKGMNPEQQNLQRLFQRDREVIVEASGGKNVAVLKATDASYTTSFFDSVPEVLENIEDSDLHKIFITPLFNVI